jgi:methyl-accepting chemotaxis protein
MRRRRKLNETFQKYIIAIVVGLLLATTLFTGIGLYSIRGVSDVVEQQRGTIEQTRDFISESAELGSTVEQLLGTVTKFGETLERLSTSIEQLAADYRKLEEFLEAGATESAELTKSLRQSLETVRGLQAINNNTRAILEENRAILKEAGD